MAGSSDAAPRPRRSWLLWLAVGAATAVVLDVAPLFHVVRLNRMGAGAASPGAPFDAVSAAERLWRQKLVPAANSAAALAPIAAAIRANPAAAVHRYGHEVGLGGTAYFFVRGRGRITSRSADAVRVAVDGASGETVELATGPVFGNTLRDGTGLLNVNDFPGLAEFNALAAELNRQVETHVQPRLRAAPLGAEVEFAGCAEVPDGTAAGAPLLTIVPVTAALVGPGTPR